MNLPSREECMELLKRENTPENIIRHTLVVNKIAVFLAKKLKEKGENVNIDLVDRASLLHDIKKWESIQNKTDASHGEIGENFLKDRYPEIAELVRKHMLYEVVDLKTWEEKIICYADKRVNHDKIVSLKQRFDYINKRYPPKNKKLRKKVYDKYFELEKEIFEKLDTSPDILNSSGNSHY